jgi:hypothetical protein
MAGTENLNSTRVKPQLPGFFAFIWLLFMQPVSFYHAIKNAGISNADLPAYALRHSTPAERALYSQYYRYMLMIMVMIAPLADLAVVLLFSRVAETPPAVEIWAIFGLAGLVLGWLVMLFIGIASGLAVGLGGAMAAGALHMGVHTAWGSVLMGLTIASVDSIVYASCYGRPYRMGEIIQSSFIMAGIIGILLGLSDARVNAALVDIQIQFNHAAVNSLIGIPAFFAALLVAYLRLPIYLIEVAWQAGAYVWQVFSGKPTLRFVPVLYHELSYLPHPFLERHLMHSAAQYPELARKVLDACSIAPGQQKIGQSVLAQLQSAELLEHLRQRHFSHIVELQGTWLPHVEGAAYPLLALREISRYLHSGNTAPYGYHRLQHLARSEKALSLLTTQLLAENSLLAGAVRNVLPAVRNSIGDLREEAQAMAGQSLPNPFRPGEPLTPEAGREVFRGREETIRRIESLLMGERQNLSLSVVGARRTGKTSLLKMLPVMLPDTVCVFFDLQDNPIDTPAHFFQALARRTLEQAQKDRHLDLPPLPPGSPFEAGSEWLKMIDSAMEDRRILFCFDEFERLETMFHQHEHEFLQLLGLFRATIQHRRHIRLLVAGQDIFSTHPMWSDYFINMSEVRLEHLDKHVTQELLARPIPDFPAQAIPFAVAEEIFERTGGQPYLAQHYGYLLVERLNENRSRSADLMDVKAVEDQVLELATYYFRNVLDTLPEPARETVTALAEGREVEMEPALRRCLLSRSLISQDNHLVIPALGRWIREYGI